MKVVLYKSYNKTSTVYYNYGDDSEEVWHNFNAVECVKEVSENDLEVLKRAIAYYNSKSGRKYTIGFIVVMEDEEVDSLLEDFKDYERKESLKAEKLHRERLEKELANKSNADAKKHEKALKKLAKELNVSVDQVRTILAKT